MRGITLCAGIPDLTKVCKAAPKIISEFIYRDVRSEQSSPGKPMHQCRNPYASKGECWYCSITPRKHTDGSSRLVWDCFK